MLPQDTPKKEDKAEDSEEEVTAGIAGVSVSGGQAAAPAPFTFNPAPKGQSPFAAGGMAAPAAPMFSFPTSGAPAGGAAQPNFSFNFAASQTKPDENKDGARLSSMYCLQRYTQLLQARSPFPIKFVSATRFLPCVCD